MNCRSHQKGMNLLREGIAHPCGTVPRLERSTQGVLRAIAPWVHGFGGCGDQRGDPRPFELGTSPGSSPRPSPGWLGVFSAPATCGETEARSSSRRRRNKRQGRTSAGLMPKSKPTPQRMISYSFPCATENTRAMMSRL